MRWTAIHYQTADDANEAEYYTRHTLGISANVAVAVDAALLIAVPCAFIIQDTLPQIERGTGITYTRIEEI